MRQYLRLSWFSLGHTVSLLLPGAPNQSLLITAPVVVLGTKLRGGATSQASFGDHTDCNTLMMGSIRGAADRQNFRSFWGDRHFWHACCSIARQEHEQGLPIQTIPQCLCVPERHMPGKQTAVTKGIVNTMTHIRRRSVSSWTFPPAARASAQMPLGLLDRAHTLYCILQMHVPPAQS